MVVHVYWLFQYEIIDGSAHFPYSVCHAVLKIYAGDCVNLPFTFTSYFVASCIKPCLQCTCTSSGMLLHEKERKPSLLVGLVVDWEYYCFHIMLACHLPLNFILLFCRWKKTCAAFSYVQFVKHQVLIRRICKRFTDY